MEEWRDISGFEGFYQISSLGRLRSVTRRVVDSRGRTIHRDGGLLKPERTRLGYLRIRLRAGVACRRVLIHRLVAETFLGPSPFPGAEVNHKKPDKADNRAENLEWCSRAGNMAHARDNGLWDPAAKLRGKGLVLTPEQALAIYHDTRTQKVIADQYGVAPSLVSAIKNGVSWSTVTGHAKWAA